MSRKKVSRRAPKAKGRWSAKRKASVVVRLLRGESLDSVARETGVTVARLTEWRESFLVAGESGLKGRRGDPEVAAFDDERRRLQAKIGEMTMTTELLEEKIDRLVVIHRSRHSRFVG